MILWKGEAMALAGASSGRRFERVTRLGEEAKVSSPPADVITGLRRVVSSGELSRASGARSLARGAGLILAATPTSVLLMMLGNWWAWLLHAAVGGIVLCTLPSVYHECAHRNLARHRISNDVVGTLAAALHFVPFATWRYFHLAHHAHTGTDEDSEAYRPNWSWSRWMMLTSPALQLLFVGQLWQWNISTLAGRGPHWVRSERQRHAVRVNTAFTLLILASLISAAVVDIRVVGLVFVPSLLGLLISSFTIVPEHFPAHNIGPDKQYQLDRTNSFRSNWLVRVIMWNSNYHAAHHFAPKVPAHCLPQVDKMISEVQDPSWRWRGYWSWYTVTMRRLPWRWRGELHRALPLATRQHGGSQ